MVSKTPMAKKAGEPAAEATRQMFQWIGQLREVRGCLVTMELSYRPADSLLSSLDAAVARHGDDLQQAYAEGRGEIDRRLQRFQATDRRIYKRLNPTPLG